MAKDGYHPATAWDLLTWKEWNGTDFVAALGSVGKVGGGLSVPYLLGYGSGRNLYLERLS